jgi:hypothetical protein
LLCARRLATQKLRSSVILSLEQFEIKTGAVLAPPAFTGVASYRVRVSGLDVELEV